MTTPTARTALKTFDSARFVRVCWSIYALLATSYILVFFHRIAPAVVSADLMRDFGATGAALGSLAAMYYYLYTVMQIPAGVLADTVGARLSVTLGNGVSGIGSILFGLADTFWEAALGRALVGLGVSVVFVGLMKSNTLWFRDRDYGFISGLTLLLGNVGALLAAGPLAGVLTIWSWRTVFVALGVLALALWPSAFWLWRWRRCRGSGCAIRRRMRVFPRSGRWRARRGMRGGNSTGGMI